MEDLKKVLVFSAHPDDIDFGCAGTAAKSVDAGKTVVYCIITNGEKGIRDPNISPAQITAIRKSEQREAAEVVGVKRVLFLGEIDGELENTNELRGKIVQVIRAEKPDIVFSFDPGNQSFDSFYRFHRDHRVAAAAVFDAVYPASSSHAFFRELGLPHQVREVWFFGAEKPDIFVDISSTFNKKVLALKKHGSQIKDTKEMEKRVRSHAKKAARKAKNKGMQYAESFRRLTF